MWDRETSKSIPLPLMRQLHRSLRPSLRACKQLHRPQKYALICDLLVELLPAGPWHAHQSHHCLRDCADLWNSWEAWDLADYSNDRLLADNSAPVYPDLGLLNTALPSLVSVLCEHRVNADSNHHFLLPNQPVAPGHLLRGHWLVCTPVAGDWKIDDHEVLVSDPARLDRKREGRQKAGT